MLAVYDKAVEYISGGSNVPEIKEFFWKWKRSHQPQTESSLDRWFHNLLKPDEMAMQDLGAFGELIAGAAKPIGRSAGWRRWVTTAWLAWAVPAWVLAAWPRRPRR